MKQQVVASMAGLLLLSSGYENFGWKTLLGAQTSSTKSNQASLDMREDVGEKNIHGQWQGKSNPILEDGGVFAQADFLYWRANEDGLDCGAVNKIYNDGLQSRSHSYLESPHEKWAPGFRITIGYSFSQQDGWDLTAMWTHFQTHQSAKKNLNKGPGDTNHFISPSWGSSLLGSFCNQTSVKWNLNYNIYDLDLGRAYFVSKTLAIHPFFGLRGAIIDQRYRADYSAVTGSSLIVPSYMHGISDFKGIGAHLGTGLQWYCTPSFSLISRAAGSLLYANFHIKQVALEITTQAGSARLARMTDHKAIGSINLEAILGMQWEKFFYQNTCRLSLTLGYEWSLWYHQNRFFENNITMSTSTSSNSAMINQRSGDLTLQGATLQARWDF